MQNTFRNEIFETFCERLADLYPDLTEAKRRSIANTLSSTALALMVENGKKLREMIAEAVLHRETFVNQFQTHIDLIDKRAKEVIANFKSNGMVSVEYDSVKRRKYLKARTTVLQDTCTFINQLNESVLTYYKLVYDLEPNNDTKQITLF
jgi:hypothetical protein